MVIFFKKQTNKKKKFFFWRRRLVGSRPISSLLCFGKGINRSTSTFLVSIFGFSAHAQTFSSSRKERRRLMGFIFDSFVVERSLVTRVAQHFEYLKKIGPRSFRHRLFHLPVRGQRTHSNARTVRYLLRFQNAYTYGI